MLSESAGRVHKLLEEHKEELGLVGASNEAQPPKPEPLLQLTDALVEYETLDANVRPSYFLGLRAHSISIIRRFNG